MPPGLVRSQQVVPLPHHSRSLLARYVRNAGRAIRGVPPLIDRVSGLGSLIEQAIAGRRYDFGVAEHFWCAPYIDQLENCCETTILDLHNIESVLHDRCAHLAGVSGRAAGTGLVRAGHRRFAAASRKLEADLLPRFSVVLATSKEDAALAGQIAPQARTAVYPNSLPWVEIPPSAELPRVVFSANFEYHPNIDAVGFLVREIWPLVRSRCPGVRLRLVGRGDSFIRHLLPPGKDTGIEVTGPVPDARAEIAQAQIVVAPLRAGSGTRIKILEAWAAARCVVATPLAAEGLEGQSGVDIALATGALAFASEVVRLLGDPVDRKRIATHGRQSFERSYSWEMVWKTLDKDLQPMRRLGVNRYTKESDALRS